MHINSTGDERAKLAAANAVAAMNGRMRNKLDALDQERLAEAILRSNAQDDLLFRNNPVRHTPPRWTLGGMLSRAVLLWRRWREDGIEDERAALSETHYKVRQSGAMGLAIAFMASLVCGVIEFGLPAELALQAARDKVRPIAASGDIVVIAQDDKSADAFGRWPWARRYDADLVDKLNEIGVKTIVFNQVFSQKTDSENDAAFAAALDRTKGKLWLGAQIERDKVNQVDITVLPLPLFRAKSLQAHGNVWHDAFWYVRNVPFSQTIAGSSYPSSATVLAGQPIATGDMRPDSAIQYKSIPTYSAIDVIQGRVDHSMLVNKSVIIGTTIASTGDVTKILGQGQVAGLYPRVIAAETIKNGVARELGWLPPLLAAMLIGMACVVQHARQRRAWTLAAGALGLLAMMLIGDRTGLHFEMIPALLLLGIFAIREYVKRKVMSAQTTHPISGLPDLTELHYIKGRENCTVLALKIEQYPAVVGKLPPLRQRDMIHAVAARIAIVSPDSVVHQGDDGLFVWLIPHGSERDFDTLPGQLIALFMVDVCDSYDTRMIGVSTGRCADLNLSFGERLAVASDRARVSAYITLREVL